MIFNNSTSSKKLMDEGFMDLLESMFLIGLVLDVSGNVQYVNPHFLRITG